MTSRFDLTRRRALTLAGAALPLTAIAGRVAFADANSILNVSYDPTAALYKDYNAAFATY